MASLLFRCPYVRNTRARSPTHGRHGRTAKPAWRPGDATDPAEQAEQAEQAEVADEAEERSAAEPAPVDPHVVVPQRVGAARVALPAEAQVDQAGPPAAPAQPLRVDVVGGRLVEVQTLDFGAVEPGAHGPVRFV